MCFQLILNVCHFQARKAVVAGMAWPRHMSLAIALPGVPGGTFGSCGSICAILPEVISPKPCRLYMSFDPSTVLNCSRARICFWVFNLELFLMSRT